MQQAGELVEGSAGDQGVEHLVGEDAGQVVPALVVDQVAEAGADVGPAVELERRGVGRRGVQEGEQSPLALPLGHTASGVAPVMTEVPMTTSNPASARSRPAVRAPSARAGRQVSSEVARIGVGGMADEAVRHRAGQGAGLALHPAEVDRWGLGAVSGPGLKYGCIRVTR